MTKEDALLYFPIEEDVEIDDLFEELLFEQKQFLSDRVPVSKVFEPRINKLNRIEEAYIFFGGEVSSNSNFSINLLPYQNELIEESFTVFQKNKNTLKLALFNALSVTEIDQIIKSIFKNYSEFAEKWPKAEPEGLNKPVISKEADPMEIISEIKSIKEKGIVNFSELLELDQDNILIKEAIRLSLWLNLEKHV